MPALPSRIIIVRVPVGRLLAFGRIER
jgi:hypothetical protein